jgi:hypothetical protein
MFQIQDIPMDTWMTSSFWIEETRSRMFSIKTSCK